jgi:hypothetical protein
MTFDRLDNIFLEFFQRVAFSEDRMIQGPGEIAAFGAAFDVERDFVHQLPLFAKCSISKSSWQARKRASDQGQRISARNWLGFRR